MLLAKGSPAMGLACGAETNSFHPDTKTYSGITESAVAHCFRNVWPRKRPEAAYGRLPKFTWYDGATATALPSVLAGVCA